MALHAVQVAMKTLIVGGIDIPESVVSREELYRDLFPNLSTEELIDLASIPPQRLQIYTDSIFAVQSGILQRNFPCSVEMITRAWPADLFGRFSPYRLAQEVHKCAAWRGLHSDSLGESLIAFLTSTRMGSSIGGSVILDMAAFELASLRIRKAPSHGFVPQSRQAFQDVVEKTSVADLLARSLVISPTLQVLPLSFDVVEGAKVFRKGGEPVECKKKSHTVVGARPIDYGSEWHEVPALVGNLLREVAQNASSREVTVAALAEALLPALVGDDDAVLFREFMVHLVRLVEIGAVATR
jgi:hypothetical protein